MLYVLLYCAAFIMIVEVVDRKKDSTIGALFSRAFAALADLKAWATKTRRAKFYDHSGRRWADKISGNGARK